MFFKKMSASLKDFSVFASKTKVVRSLLLAHYPEKIHQQLLGLYYRSSDQAAEITAYLMDSFKVLYSLESF